MVEVSSEPSHQGQTVSSKQEAEKITLYKQLRLGLSSTYYSMAQVLGLRRLQDYIQVGSTHLVCCHWVRYIAMEA